MFHQTTVLVLILFACLSYGVQTSLYFPGFDSQPLSADFVSTDSGGHTVWAVHVTQEAGGDFGSPGVMTLTEGSSYTQIGTNGAVATGALTGTDTAVAQLPTNLGTEPAEPASGNTSFPTSAKSALGSIVSSTGPVASPSKTNAAAITASPVTNSNSASSGKSTIGLKACLSLVAFFYLYVAL